MSYTHNCQNSGSLLLSVLNQDARQDVNAVVTSKQQILFSTKIIVMERHGRNSNAHLSENPSEAAMYCVIPTTRHSEKCQTMEMIKKISSY